MNKYKLTHKLLKEYPQIGSELKKLLSLIRKSKPIKDYISFLNDQLKALKTKQQKDTFAKITSSSNSQFIECIAELTILSLWRYLKLNFEKDFKINGKTPDFIVTIDENNSFIAEVTTLRSNHPHREIIIKRKKRNLLEFVKSIFSIKPIKPTLIIQDQSTDEILDKLPPSTQSIEQSHRINIEIKQKYNIYSTILKKPNKPFVICFYQPDFNAQFFIDEFQIKNALYGTAKMNFNTGEVIHEPELKKDKFSNFIYEGLFCFSEYSHLSAVIFITKQFSVEKQKYYFSISIYSNPLGEWAYLNNNPFSKLGFAVNSIDANENILLVEPNHIELY